MQTQMRPIPAWELTCYVLVVAVLQVLVIKDGWQLSDAAATALARPDARRHLPTRLTAMLQVPPAFLDGSWAQNVSILQKPLAWLRSRPRDVSDVQWRDFRGGLGMIAAAMAGFVCVSRLVRLRGGRMRVLNSAMASIVLIGVIHGPSGTLWVFILAGISFVIAKAVAGTRIGPAVIWGWHIASFLFIRWNNGLSFGAINPKLAFLDGHSSMLRWHIHYNFLLLRLLSFAMDLHWARLQQKQQQQEQKQQKQLKQGSSQEQQQHLKHLWLDCAKRGALSNPKTRIETPLPPAMYSGLLHFVYCFYPPLYIAGPTMAFNDFASQMAVPVKQTPTQVVTYGARWAFAAGLLELMSRTLYFNAIAKHGLLSKGVLATLGVHVTPYHFALTGFWVLVYMWLKFLVIWRFFRAIALADGIIPPENMGRCVCNNYDIEGFWRSWHSSYNRWLVRYLYVPMGGNRTRAVNVWAVFLFVAAWHDLEPRLLHWGLIMPVVLMPEMAVKAFGRSPLAMRYAHTRLYRYSAALAATFNIIGLMCVNLVGFVVGVEGLRPLLSEILAWRVAVPILATIFCAVQLMFAIRIREEASAPVFKNGRQTQ